jgi:hypothetical protein
LSTNRPAGGTTDAIRDGYNQYWDLGAGQSVNRTPLPANHGLWPNLIKLNRTGTNQLAYGQNGSVNITFQWARPATSNATVSLHLDDDFNPFNGNDRLLRQVTIPGTTSNNIGSGPITFTLASTNSTPGVHALYAKVTGGGRTRYLYAPETLAVVSSYQPPQLGLVRVNSNQVRVDVTGLTGQRVALHSSTDLRNWQPLTTNWLTSSLWSYLDNTTGQPRKFYRAVLP